MLIFSLLLYLIYLRKTIQNVFDCFYAELFRSFDILS